MSYKKFDSEMFSVLKARMEDARKPVEANWMKIREAYLPENLIGRLLTELNIDTDSGLVAIDRILGAAGESQDGLLQSKEPLVAVKVHTALSLLTQRTPNVLWDSDNASYEKLVPVISGLRDKDWLDTETRLQYVMLWFFLIMYGETNWRRFYLKDERDVFLPDEINLETKEVSYKPSTMVDFDGTRAEALSPFQVWSDPGARPNAPSSNRMVMYEKIMDHDTFMRRFKDLVPSKKLEEIKPGPADGYEGDNYYRLRCYEHMDWDLYYIEANDKPLIKDHLPWNHKQLSVLSAIWMPRDERSPHGLGPIEMMLDNKYKLDKLEGMTLSQVKYSIYKSFFYSGHIEGEGEGGDLSIRPDRAYKASNPGDIKLIESKGPGEDAWKAIERQRERIDDITGINRPLGGEIVKTTAFQTDLAKDAALARLSTPINHMVSLLTQDAYLMLELQRQYYSLPEVKELVDQDELNEAMLSLKQAELEGKPASFDLWFEEGADEGERVFRGDYRVERISQANSDGIPDISGPKHQAVLRPEVFDWKGKMYVVADSLLTITPTLERTRKLEVYNMLIPLFSQPPELVAKPAKQLAKLYGIEIKDLFPESWLMYLKSIQEGTPAPQTGVQPQVTQPGGPMAFEQPGASVVTTNMGGQKDMISAQSEKISP